MNQVSGGPCSQHVVDLSRSTLFPVPLAGKVPIRLLFEKLLDSWATNISPRGSQVQHVLPEVDEPEIFHEFRGAVGSHAFRHPRIKVLVGIAIEFGITVGHLEYVMIFVQRAPRIFDRVFFTLGRIGGHVLVENRRILSPGQPTFRMPLENAFDFLCD